MFFVLTSFLFMVAAGSSEELTNPAVQQRLNKWVPSLVSPLLDSQILVAIHFRFVRDY
jgi:hypothetical protein